MDYDKLIKAFNERNPFTNSIGVLVTEAKEDFAAGEVQYSDNITNRNKYVHGGVYLSFADTLAGAAVHTNGAMYVTQSCSFQFYKATQGETLYGSATVRHRGRKTCIVATELKHADGTLVADGLFSFFKISE
jgi:acyl-CoA thioesterase